MFKAARIRTIPFLMDMMDNIILLTDRSCIDYDPDDHQKDE